MTSHKTWFDVLAECSFGLMEGTGAQAEAAPTSTVVRIGNVVTPEELTDDEAQKEVRTRDGPVWRPSCLVSAECLPSVLSRLLAVFP